MVNQAINPLDSPESTEDLADMLSQIENAEQLAELLTILKFTRTRLNRATRRLPPIQQELLRQWVKDIKSK